MGDRLAAVDVNVVKDRSARSLLLAVTARAPELADVLCVKIRDLERAATVVLEELIGGVAGTAALDRGGAAGLAEGGAVFADLVPPAVSQVSVYGTG